MDSEKSGQAQEFQAETYYSKSANTHHGRITAMEHLENVQNLSHVFGADVGKPNSAGILEGGRKDCALHIELPGKMCYTKEE